MVCSLLHIRVWHSAEPSEAEDLLEAVVYEGLDLVGADIGDSPCFISIKFCTGAEYPVLGLCNLVEMAVDLRTGCKILKLC